MTWTFLTDFSAESKMKVMKFVYENTNSFIMNTFGYVWEGRKWWGKHPIMLMMEGETIIGLHAFTVNAKNSKRIKTYYIVTHRDYRGKGIAKTLTFEALKEFRNKSEIYFVNSEESSDGVAFYKKLFNNTFTLKQNEFGTNDYEFFIVINKFLDDNTN